MLTELLTCTIHASRRLRLSLRVLHGLAGLSLLAAELSWSARLIGLALIALGAGLSLRRSAPVTLRCLADGGLLVADGQAWSAVELLPGSLVLPWCCILRLRAAGRVRAVVILADSLDSEDFRRLRVWLRWKATWLRAPRWPVLRP